MKKLHLAKADETRPDTKYAEVKNGKVVVLNPYFVIVLATEDVFGAKVDGHFYIDRKMWNLLKFPAAKLIDVDGLILKNITAGTEMKAIAADEFEKSVTRYPDWSVVLPDWSKPRVPTETICFDPEYYKVIADTLGIAKPRINFYGPDKGMIIDCDGDKGFALLMPIYISNADTFTSAFYNPAPEVTETEDPLA